MTTTLFTILPTIKGDEFYRAAQAILDIPNKSLYFIIMQSTFKSSSMKKLRTKTSNKSKAKECWLILVESGEYDTTIAPFSTEVLVLMSRRILEAEEVPKYSLKSAYVIIEVKWEEGGYKLEVMEGGMVLGGEGVTVGAGIGEEDLKLGWASKDLAKRGVNCYCPSLKWLDTIAKEEISMLIERAKRANERDTKSARKQGDRGRGRGRVVGHGHRGLCCGTLADEPAISQESLGSVPIGQGVPPAPVVPEKPVILPTMVVLVQEEEQGKMKFLKGLRLYYLKFLIASGASSYREILSKVLGIEQNDVEERKSKDLRSQQRQDRRADKGKSVQTQYESLGPKRQKLGVTDEAPNRFMGGQHSDRPRLVLVSVRTAGRGGTLGSFVQTQPEVLSHYDSFGDLLVTIQGLSFSRFSKDSFRVRRVDR
ncbi:hypothetical protein GIB67_039795 [Kingdonia uniflora]|uniref:Uncharacterized protein n=1 Tax=Kingdonia uniflora TaxID=39325 RepID=A0A7J7P3Y1_9MAGN|nr:hypothetical protein GIB67_039795 [Kingdonia uniflora]